MPLQSIGPLFTRALDLYKEHWKGLLGTCALLFVPVAVLTQLFFWLADAGATSAAHGGLPALFAGVFGVIVSSFVLYALIVPVTNAAATVAVADLEAHGAFHWQAAWGQVVRRAAPLALTLVPAALAVAAGLLLCLVPGALLAFAFAFLPQVVLVEHRSGIDAMKRSMALVRSDWRRVSLVLIAFGLASSAAHFVAGLVTPAGLAEAIVGDLLYLAILPFPVIGQVLLYFEVRRKLDGAEPVAVRWKTARAEGSNGSCV